MGKHIVEARRILPAALATVTLFAQFGLVAPAIAAESVSPQQVAEYLGTWNLAASFRGSPVQLVLEIIDDEGEVKAALRAAPSRDPQLVETITRTDEGLELAYDTDFGGNTLRIEVKAALQGASLVGSFGDENGLFRADFTGTRATEPAGIVAAAVLGAAAEGSGTPRRRIGSIEAELDLGSGKMLTVRHAPLELDSDDHRRLHATAPGQVFGYDSRTIKLLTDADLVFGETRVKAFNLAPNYPGCYAVWMKRVDDGWRLVFNTQADNWGTQYMPDTDVAEIPLEIAELATPQQELRVELAAKEGGGQLRILWGKMAWSTSFRIEQPAGPSDQAGR